MTDRSAKRVKKDEENDSKALSLEELEKLLKNDEKVMVGGADIDGVLRGKTMKKSKFLSTIKDGFGFCSVVFGWDIHDKVYDNVAVSNAENGFKDVLGKVDTSTLRRQPWNNNTPFFCLDFYNENMTPLDMCPRNLLKKIIGEVEAAGFKPYSSVEFEFYNFKETPHSIEDKKYTDLTPLTPGMFGYSLLRPSMFKDYFNELYEFSSKYDIPLEAIHTETGPGVYEVAIEYTDALKSADRAALFKTTAKEIGLRHQIMPSFMAKPNASLPGCSGHTHYSLWDLEGKKNLFFDEKDPKKMSDVMKHFIAGQLHCLPYIAPMLVPNVNSYKRLVEGAWAPVVLSWGLENRTSTIRVINPNEKGIRVELRLGGADINPYLAMAAALASGLYGIKNKLPLPAESSGDNLANKALKKLPANLLEASKAMGAKDSVARELFGNGFVDHFVATRDWEWRQFQRAVTDWEFRRYFELI